ncbi:MAG: exosortase/archaeosortase family protein [Verrucomicrobiales bacterium]
MRWFAAFLVILTVAFGWPLGLLAVHAANSNLHSHILLIPFICIYLLHMKWPELPRDYQTSPGWAALPIVGGCGALAAAVVAVFGEGTLPLSHNDRLALVAFSFFCFLWAGGFLFLGRNWVAQAAFPLGFFLFLVPLPDGFVNWAENGLVLGSAEATDLFYRLSGTPVFREGTIFQLPGIVLEVARECSGIRSTWVLVITSLLASYLFLKNPWHRAVLVALVIPLGILRNGFRILVIGLLCVHIGPEMIDSIVHKKGGPLFFALSLVPLFAVAWWLSRRERKE